MSMSEFYSEFLFRYQTEGAPEKISINSFCLREGVEYANFIRWYRENKKRMREVEMEEIRVSPIHVTGCAPAPSSGFSSSNGAEAMNVLSVSVQF